MSLFFKAHSSLFQHDKKINCSGECPTLAPRTQLLPLLPHSQEVVLAHPANRVTRTKKRSGPRAQQEPNNVAGAKLH